MVDFFRTKLSIETIHKDHIRSCYRLGKASGDKPRALLVKFSEIPVRKEVWQAKTLLKGSSISIAEFLTPHRRVIFKEARRLHGMRKCWTQDGNIYLKTNNGDKIRLSSIEQLAQYPSTQAETAAKTNPPKLRVRPAKK